jgi:hypothetical protein
MNRLFALALVLLSAGCAAPKPITMTRIQLVSPNIPQVLLTCPASPVIPAATSQAVVAQYIVALWQAGMVCRDHLDAIRKALAKQPV